MKNIYKIIFTCSIGMLYNPAVYAENDVFFSKDFTKPVFKSFADDMTYLPQLTIGGGYGDINNNNAGFAKTNLYIPILQSAKQVIYVDGHFYGDSSTQFDAGLATGYRILSNDDSMFGIYGAIDNTYKNDSSNNFLQATVGAELWLNKLFIGANYYKIIGDNSKDDDDANETEIRSDNECGDCGHIWAAPGYEEAMDGYDATIGTNIWKNLDTYITYYHYDGDNVDNIDGGELKAEYNWYSQNNSKIFGIFSRINMSTSASYDNVYDFSWNVGMNFSINLFSKNQENLTKFQQHMLDPIRRREYVETQTYIGDWQDTQQETMIVHNEDELDDALANDKVAVIVVDGDITTDTIYTPNRNLTITGSSDHTNYSFTYNGRLYHATLLGDNTYGALTDEAGKPLIIISDNNCDFALQYISLMNDDNNDDYIAITNNQNAGTDNDASYGDIGTVNINHITSGNDQDSDKGGTYNFEITDGNQGIINFNNNNINYYYTLNNDNSNNLSLIRFRAEGNDSKLTIDFNYNNASLYTIDNIGDVEKLFTVDVESVNHSEVNINQFDYNTITNDFTYNYGDTNDNVSTINAVRFLVNIDGNEEDDVNSAHDYTTLNISDFSYNNIIFSGVNNGSSITLKATGVFFYESNGNSDNGEIIQINKMDNNILNSNFSQQDDDVLEEHYAFLFKTKNNTSFQKITIGSTDHEVINNAVLGDWNAAFAISNTKAHNSNTTDPSNIIFYVTLDGDTSTSSVSLPNNNDATLQGDDISDGDAVNLLATYIPGVANTVTTTNAKNILNNNWLLSAYIMKMKKKYIHL